MPTRRSTLRLIGRPLASVSSSMVNHWLFGSPSSSAVSWRLVVLLQPGVPGEDLGVALQALDAHLAGAGRAPARCAAPPPRRSACTWRSVTGSIASALRSTTPNGAAANLAIGGAAPVATLSGKLARWRAAGRRCPSARSAGRRCRPRSRPAAWERRSRSPRSALSSLSNTGRERARRSPAPAATCAASARGTGAEKRRLIGRIGRHGAAAFSRSQLNSAVKAARTRRRKRCSIVVTTCGLAAAAMPLPQTRRSAASLASGRSQRAISSRGHCACADAARLQQLRALLAAEEHQRQPLADAFDLAAGVGQHARLDRRAVEADQEVLVFLDLGAVAGLHRDDRRAAGGEAELARPGERRRRGRRRSPRRPASIRGAASRVQRVPGGSASRKS